MIIGASATSTGGALKVIRVQVLVKFLYRQIILVFSPNTVRHIRVAEKIIPEGVINRIVGLSTLYIIVLIIGFLIMTSLGLDLVTAVSAVAATLGNVGPGLGAVGPMANYASIPAAGKVVLTFCMLIGRLELWTVLAILTPIFWKS